VRIDFLFWRECPSHPEARALLREVLEERGVEAEVVERERSSDDGRIALLRLTPEGEQRLAKSFTSNAAERNALRQAFAHLDIVA